MIRKNISLLYQSKHIYETEHKTKVHHNSRDKTNIRLENKNFKEEPGLPAELFVYILPSLLISSHSTQLLVRSCDGGLYWSLFLQKHWLFCQKQKSKLLLTFHLVAFPLRIYRTEITGLSLSSRNLYSFGFGTR